MSVEDYGKFLDSHLERIGVGLELYNKGEYWECHEVLEDPWIEDPCDNARNVYWAVIQVAAALVHFHNGNIIGARSLIKKAKQKIDRCETLGVETQLLFDFVNWEEFKKLVKKLPEDFELPVLQELDEFRFVDYFEKYKK